MTPDATVSWALDGGALALYDWGGDPNALGTLVAAAEEIARARFAAVITTELDARDPRLAALEALGFACDWSEEDVRGGERFRRVLLVRATG